MILPCATVVAGEIAIALSATTSSPCLGAEAQSAKTIGHYPVVTNLRRRCGIAHLPVSGVRVDSGGPNGYEIQVAKEKSSRVPEAVGSIPVVGGIVKQADQQAQWMQDLVEQQAR